MHEHDKWLTSGIVGLDKILKGILRGDNIVWQVDHMDDFRRLIPPYVDAAKKNGRRVVYFRYAHHAPLITDPDVETYTLRCQEGFESFIAQVHQGIEKAGRGAFYVFDCLSHLAVEWYSDQMLGNFFLLTCPYLFDLETVAYFPIFRNYHTQMALDPILSTTQLFLDVYHHRDSMYIRPVKVQHRYSSTMHMLHAWKSDDTFQPVSSSAVISEIMAKEFGSGFNHASESGFWETSFIRAKERLKSDSYRKDLSEEEQGLYDKLVKTIITRDEDMIRLISRFFTIHDIMDIHNRMIGTGLIGGKSVGMLLARKILKKQDERFNALLETQDSFYIGSDAFYTFLVENGIWSIRQQQRNPDNFLEGAEVARHRIHTGTFSSHIMRQFDQMLDYYGQSPFIVRSSSLLEDNYGNSFAGKYESVFCANQGPRDRRMQDFLAAVRTVYASSMSTNALRYRAQRDMLDKDEQMGLLVMRVSGAMYGRNFFPQAAGVGFSFNPYVWDPEIDASAGVIRLVFGMGTRAVDRSDDDYTRVVALNAPNKRPEANFDEVREYTQRRVDYLDMDANQLITEQFSDLIKEHHTGLCMDMFTSPDRIRLPDGRWHEGRMLTFDQLLNKTPFVKDMQEVLSTLQEEYAHPVDIEFSLNFMEDKTYRINLLQCRPLQVQGTKAMNLPDVQVARENLIIEARGAVVGQSRMSQIQRFIYVSPERYGLSPMRDRYDVAHLIGELNRDKQCEGPVMLIGPGRWGTSSPSLGIPVNFADINRVLVLCEIVAMHENLVPDVSLGTHFLNELIEMNMLYLALFPNRGSNYLNSRFFEGQPNKLTQIVPTAERWVDMVHVIDTADLTDPRPVNIIADAMEQKVLCYFDQ